MICGNSWFLFVNANNLYLSLIPQVFINTAAAATSVALDMSNLSGVTPNDKPSHLFSRLELLESTFKNIAVL